MIEMDAEEAGPKLDELIDAAHAGEEVFVTVNGRVIARIDAIEDGEPETVSA